MYAVIENKYGGYGAKFYIAFIGTEKKCQDYCKTYNVYKEKEYTEDDFIYIKQEYPIFHIEKGKQNIFIGSYIE